MNIIDRIEAIRDEEKRIRKDVAREMSKLKSEEDDNDRRKQNNKLF